MNKKITELTQATEVNNEDIFMLIQNNENKQVTAKTISTYIENLMQSAIAEAKLAENPVGTIRMTTTNVNPSSYLGGTWVAWGSGRVPVGVDTEDSSFNAVEKMGGSKTHAITASEMPSHNHSVNLTAVSGGNHSHTFSGSTNNTGAHTHSNDSLIYWGSNGDGVNGSTNTGWRVSIKDSSSAGAHTHTFNGSTNNTGAHTHNVSGNTGSSGSGTAMSLVQPYITCYMWKRTE